MQCSKAALHGVNVRFGSKADIASIKRDVRFTPNSGHWPSALECPLCAISGRPPPQHRSRVEWNVSAIEIIGVAGYLPANVEADRDTDS
jgi:hypothetical protein